MRQLRHLAVSFAIAITLVVTLVIALSGHALAYGKNPVDPHFTKPRHGITTSAPTTATASNCWNNPSHLYCDNVDPQASGCSSDAYTVLQTNLYYNGVTNLGLLQLRYSPHCKTNWTRFQPELSMYVDVHIIGDYGYPDYYNIVNNTSQTVWTPMYYAPNEPVAAYGQVTYNGQYPYKFLEQSGWQPG